MSTENDFSWLPPLPETPIKSLTPAQAKTKTQKIFPIVLKILKVTGKVLLWLVLAILASLPEKKQEEEPSETDILTGEPYPEGNSYNPPKSWRKYH